MDADTLAALSIVNQRLAVLEAGTAAVQAASANATAAANAQAISSAQELAAIQEQALLASQARQAAWAAIQQPGFSPYPGWRPGQPYPLHGIPGRP